MTASSRLKKQIAATSISILLLSFSVYSKEHYQSVTVSEITSIYDADTFRINIKGYPDVIGKHIPVRVLGIDAPELRGKCQSEKDKARAAKQFTVAILRNGNVIELRNIQRGKYFRLLADVYIDGRSLGQDLINSGHARTYNGGKRSGWC